MKIIKNLFWNEINEQETLKKRIMKIKAEKINKVNKIKGHKNNRINKRHNKRSKNKASKYIKPNRKEKTEIKKTKNKNRIWWIRLIKNLKNKYIAYCLELRFTYGNIETIT